MPTFISDARFEVGGYTVNIGAHQWGFADGATYPERQLGTTPYGTIHRQRYGITVRQREVRFVKSNLLLDQLRRLSIMAATTGALVKFTPNVADAGTFWWVVWPASMTFEPVMDNRDEITLQLQEQSPGV